jgi:hypothetical protein
MEENGNVTEVSKNLLSYKDIDTTTNEFIQYFQNDFLQYFPKEILANKAEVTKLAKQLYQSKGTPASYQFLFRVLYNSDFDVFYTKDAVLRASSGTWYVARSLKLDTNNPNFLNIAGYKLFGETSKALAIVENSVLSNNKIEVFISNIERVFQSGEYITVIDSNNQPVNVSGNTLTSLSAQVTGAITGINVDVNNKGLFYNPGDPVIVYGGLTSSTVPGAVAQVGVTSLGSILSVSVTNGGYGYTPDSLIKITNIPNANAIIGSLNPGTTYSSNVTLFPIDSINNKANVVIGNTSYGFANNASANANTSLLDTLNFESFSVYPISSAVLISGGSNVRQKPNIIAVGAKPDDNQDTANAYAYFTNIGILAAIQIANGGAGYQANDTIVFSGGSGYGAYANVTTVSGTGAITGVQYVAGPEKYPLGGMGYRNDSLPTVSVISANTQASGASLTINSIIGTGASFDSVTDVTGAVKTINLTYGGENYISTPNVSLVVEDILVSNVSISNLPQQGDLLTQNTYTNPYISTVDSISLLSSNFINPNDYLYNLRVFNYNSTPNTQLPLIINSKNINMLMANQSYGGAYNTNGIKIYGDGRARAAAVFSNDLGALFFSQGQYLDSTGQLSSYSVLQSQKYNNYTYQITVQQEISKYRDILLNLLHPTGMKMLGRYGVQSNTAYDFVIVTDQFNQGYPLNYYTGNLSSYITMNTQGSNGYYNVVTFYSMNGHSVLDTLAPNTIISFETANGISITSQVDSSNSQSNTVTFKDGVWLTENLTATAANVKIFGTSIFG